MLIPLVGSVNCSELKQREPDHITYKHSVSCESFFQIIEPTNVDIVSRKVDGAKLANSIVFSWCDGKRSSIEEALKRDFKQFVDLSKVSRKEGDDILGQNRLKEHFTYCCEVEIRYLSLLGKYLTRPEYPYYSCKDNGLVCHVRDFLRRGPGIG